MMEKQAIRDLQRVEELVEEEDLQRVQKQTVRIMLLVEEEAGGGWYGGGAGGGGALAASSVCAGSAGGSGNFGNGGKGGNAYQGAMDAYYGGSGGSGAGGSGYVYTSGTASNYPSGCLLNSSYYLTSATTYAGNTSFTAPGGGTETGHSGNGYARITLVE